MDVNNIVDNGNLLVFYTVLVGKINNQKMITSRIQGRRYDSRSSFGIVATK